MKKRLISLVLVLVMLLTLLPLASALSPPDAANRLHSLGLFQGVGQNADGTPNFALYRAPTRAEAITMFVRLIGASDAAHSGTRQTPFTDVPDWARPYVGYAYANALTNGIGPTTFGSEYAAEATQYLTFILRALGYTSGTDFQWDSAWELTDYKGITDGRFHAETTEFLRGDVAVVSFDALSATFSGSEQTLYAALIEAGMFTADQWAAAQSPQTPPPPPSNVRTFTGSGDDVLSLTPFPGEYVFVIRGNAAARHFAVWAQGARRTLLVNTTAVYEGTTRTTGQDTHTLEVTAVGDWTIEQRPLSDMRAIAQGQTVTGSGPSVLRITSHGATAFISGNSEGRHFAVWARGDRSSLLVNTTSEYSGRVALRGTYTILEITAVGNWSITFE